jgi:hypothetical protein
MKCQFKIARVIGIVLITFSLIACEEPGITGVTNLETDNSPTLTNGQSDLVGTWIQLPANGDQGKERTLTFTNNVIGGLGKMFYPDQTGLCGGQPELYKQFEWWNDYGTGSIKIKIIGHSECGVEKYKSGREEFVSYFLHTDTLRIFSHSWIREQ